MSKVESIEDLLKQQTELQAKIEKIRSEEKSKVIEELKKQEIFVEQVAHFRPVVSFENVGNSVKSDLTFHSTSSLKSFIKEHSSKNKVKILKIKL